MLKKKEWNKGKCGLLKEIEEEKDPSSAKSMWLLSLGEVYTSRGSVQFSPSFSVSYAHHVHGYIIPCMQALI